MNIYFFNHFFIIFLNKKMGTDDFSGFRLSRHFADKILFALLLIGFRLRLSFCSKSFFILFGVAATFKRQQLKKNCLELNGKV